MDWIWLENDTAERLVNGCRLFEQEWKRYSFVGRKCVPWRWQRRPLKSFIYGDSSPIDARTRDAFLYLNKFAFEHSAKVCWTEGDILVINNDEVMHARETFLPPRRILVSLLQR